MTLETFLLSHIPLTAVDLLPDNRLINVVIAGGQLFGVEVDDIPTGAVVTRFDASLTGSTITADGLTFDTTAYEMLGSP